MQEAWIPLTCPDCGDQWEAEPSSLPRPGTDFACPYCGASRKISEFVKTERGLDILIEFHGESVGSK